MSLNFDSPAQLSSLLFGGTLKEEIREVCLDESGCPIVFKSGKNKGKIKTRLATKERIIPGVGFKPIGVKGKSGNYSTGEEILRKLLLRSSNEAKDIIQGILKKRELSKLISTYYKGLSELIYTEDNCVHANFLHVKTNTGRLASSNPNLQNVASGIVKEHFVSRFPNGKLIQADFSQLEICVQAQLSGDKKYIADIAQGIDFHTKRLALKERMPYEEVYKKIKIEEDEVWIDKRSKIKQFSFQRAYGAGAFHISESTGMSVDEIKDLIKLEEAEYIGLTRYNAILKNFVEHTSSGDTGYYLSPLGRKYVFLKQDAPKWLKEKGIDKSFKPTEIQNYIVQGTGFDIVAMFLGRLFREAIKHRDKFLLVNTVHDSVIIDCKEEYTEECCNIINNVLYSLNQYLKEQHSFKVEIKIDIKVGNNWSEI